MTTELKEDGAVPACNTASGVMNANDVQLPMGKKRVWKRIQPAQFARIKNKKYLKEDDEMIIKMAEEIADKYVLECLVGDTILEQEILN